jgi:PKD repeat protein
MRFLLTFAFTCIIFAGLQAQCTINFTPTNPCPGETVTFSIDNPTTGVTYTWDFDGDGNADDTGTSVGYSFPFNNTAQSYPIEAFADGTSCDQTTINVLASPEVAVNALGTGVNQSGNSITACTGSPDVSFELFNTSPSPGSNSSYEVNWGDGSPVENYTNATWGGAITISHDFSGFGFFPITITTTHNNGCTRTQTFSFYNGSNPSVGLANPGNTVGLCAPATLDFPITNTANNPPGTTYEIFLNDMLIATYDQNNIPAIFTYTFDESSCGETTSNGQYENSFELSITASNPCNSSSATIQPIQLSSSPEPGINVIEPANNCPGEVFTFQDVSTNINEVGNQTCENELTQFWSITPGTDGNEWTLLSGTFVGSEELDVQFDVPGTYTVTLTLNSAACGQVMISETVTITTPPLADAITDYDPIADECAPSTINFTNLSSGPQLSFTWQVDQPNGWQFTGGTDENSENPSIQFTQPGTYAVSLTTSNVCDNDLWDTTFVFAGPPSATIDPLGNFCETAAITLDANNVSYSENGSPISNYSWTFSGGTPSSSTQEFPGTINYNSVGNYTIELTLENGCGPTTVSTNFSVIAPPVLTLPLNTTVCEDEPPFPADRRSTGRHLVRPRDY